MDQETRIKYFSNLLKKEPYSYKDIYYKQRKQKLPVYQIDLDYLIYNQWNGRIASLVKSHYKETGIEIDANDSEGAKLIEEFLWKSSENANKATEKSIADHGQNEYGIVTKDGVIIDGNRRSMILRRVAKKRNESPAYFLGVVLDENLSDNPKEIMSLETRYQMGEDAKVDYNPIEKYLKCKDMKQIGFSEEEIAKDMGETESAIKEYLSIMELMDEYLAVQGYPGIYTRLEKTEDLFINLNKSLKTWSKSSGRVQWNYDESDLSDYKLITFDLIRYSYNSHKGVGAKDIREKLTKNSEDSFFAHKDIWQEFSRRHQRTVEPIESKIKSIDKLREENPGRDLTSLLKSRDEMWAKEVDTHIKENFGLTSAALENLQTSNQPLKLLSAALAKIESVDKYSRAFVEEEQIYETLKEILFIVKDYKRIIEDYRENNQ